MFLTLLQYEIYKSILLRVLNRRSHSTLLLEFTRFSPASVSLVGTFFLKLIYFFNFYFFSFRNGYVFSRSTFFTGWSTHRHVGLSGDELPSMRRSHLEFERDVCCDDHLGACDGAPVVHALCFPVGD